VKGEIQVGREKKKKSCERLEFFENGSDLSINQLVYVKITGRGNEG